MKRAPLLLWGHTSPGGVPCARFLAGYKSRNRSAFSGPVQVAGCRVSPGPSPARCTGGGRDPQPGQTSSWKVPGLVKSEGNSAALGTCVAAFLPAQQEPVLPTGPGLRRTQSPLTEGGGSFLRAKATVSEGLHDPVQCSGCLGHLEGTSQTGLCPRLPHPAGLPLWPPLPGLPQTARALPRAIGESRSPCQAPAWGPATAAESKEVRVCSSGRPPCGRPAVQGARAPPGSSSGTLWRTEQAPLPIGNRYLTFPHSFLHYVPVRSLSKPPTHGGTSQTRGICAPETQAPARNPPAPPGRPVSAPWSPSPSDGPFPAGPPWCPP